MAYEGRLETIPGLVANADLSTHQFKLVTLNSSKKVILSVSSGGYVLGVLQDKPDALDKAASVAPLAGIVSKVKAGAAVTAGALVMSDGAGLAITATATNYAFGMALEAAANSGEVITVLLQPFGVID